MKILEKVIKLKYLLYFIHNILLHALKVIDQVWDAIYLLNCLSKTVKNTNIKTCKV